MRPGITISLRNLTILSLSSLIILSLSQIFTQHVPHPEAQKMLAAAYRMQQAGQVLNEYRKKIEPINLQQDPLQTGFIGVEFSPITTTLGDLSAKMISTNPDFAALFIFWFNQLSLAKGSKIIIQTSGSFPALSIAAIIAAEVYGLQPVIFSSAGASSFGANLPRLTYWDMENYLFTKGVISHRTLMATPGGQNDNGSSFWPGGLEIVREAAKRNGYPLFIAKNLNDAIETKLKYMDRNGEIAAFINIGGNQSAVGLSSCALKIPAGIIQQPLVCRTETDGLIQVFSARKIPVIHLLHIKDIAARYGITVALSRQTKPGLSRFYEMEKKSLAVFFLLFLVLILLWIVLTRGKFPSRSGS